MTPPRSRIPVKLHKNVSLLVVADEFVAREILARKSLSRMVIGQVSPTALLVETEEEESLVEELKRLGHAPRVVR
ncbi:MAG: hypothetical protein KGM43_11830 [Planctomycetota bacterium]|nr:hypothetical protein [Planctomycetota bacterium]